MDGKRVARVKIELIRALNDEQLPTQSAVESPPAIDTVKSHSDTSARTR